MTAAPRRRVVVAVVVALGVAALASCSVQTATSPTGNLTLYAVFDDAQDLTAGHTVQVSNVVVGSVRGVSLDGYRARVRMSIVDGREIPVGTRAVIRRTSLLGEYFVDLVFPDGFDPATGEYLASGAEIVDTETQPDVEQLAQEAAGVVGAIAADDLAATIQAGSEALGGRGQTLNRLVARASQVVGVLADQQTDLAATVDGLAQLGAAVAPASDRIAALIDDLAAATENVAGSRDRIVAAVDALVDLATVTNEAILVPHADRLAHMLAQLNPLLAELADRSDVLADLAVDFFRFTAALPTTMHNGRVLLLTWGYLPTALQQTPLAGADPLTALAELLRSSP